MPAERSPKRRRGVAAKTGGKCSAERSPLTLEAVVLTARELLAQDGLEALSLRRVATRMGVTAPALYAHVDDKLDLMRKLGEDGFQRLIDRLEPISQDDPLEEIREIAKMNS